MPAHNPNPAPEVVAWEHNQLRRVLARLADAARARAVVEDDDERRAFVCGEFDGALASAEAVLSVTDHSKPPPPEPPGPSASVTKAGTRLSVTLHNGDVHVLAEGHGTGYGFTIPAKQAQATNENEALAAALRLYVVPLEQLVREKAILGPRRKGSRWITVNHPRARLGMSFAANGDGTFKIDTGLPALSLEQLVERIVWGFFLTQVPSDLYR